MLLAIFETRRDRERAGPQIHRGAVDAEAEGLLAYGLHRGVADGGAAGLILVEDIGLRRRVEGGAAEGIEGHAAKGLGNRVAADDGA